MKRENLFHGVRTESLDSPISWLNNSFLKCVFFPAPTRALIYSCAHPNQFGSSLAVIPSSVSWRWAKKGVRDIGKRSSAQNIFPVRFYLHNLSVARKKTVTRDVVISLFPTPPYRAGICRGGLNMLKWVKEMCVPLSIKTFFFLNSRSPTICRLGSGRKDFMCHGRLTSFR